jgi:hypothetical protein
MGYSYGPGAIVPFGRLFQVGDFTNCFVDVQFPLVVKDRHTCGIISAIFQTVQAPYKYRICLAASEISYYSTHIYSFSKNAQI